MSININEFLKNFRREYKFLYDNGDSRVAGYSEAVDAFDDFAKNHRDFVGEFVKFRGEFVSSDREAAAFMFALEDMMA